jgi:hypothetical protein
MKQLTSEEGPRPPTAHKVLPAQVIKHLMLLTRACQTRAPHVEIPTLDLSLKSLTKNAQRPLTIR